jgi:hypothetical protein
MHIKSEPAHNPPLDEAQRESGGTHDIDGFVLSAHRDESQGRPRTTPSSKLISATGLPDRVSQQRPLFPEPKGSRWRRTAVSCPDNAFSYAKNRSLRDLLAARGIRHLTTRPYRPRTNGKIERFHQTMGREWAHGRSYPSSAHRASLLKDWLEHYNHRRPHSAIGDRAPITRVLNLSRQDS